MIYVVVPRDLADVLHDGLREHFSRTVGVEVIVDRRRPHERGRGRGPERRQALHVEPVLGLPAFALEHQGRLSFVELSEPVLISLADAESLRLVRRAQSGDEGAFEQLYTRYFAPVYAYHRHGLGDPHEAEDLTQQTWLRVERGLQTFEVRPGVPFRHWLLRIARRVLLSEFERRGRVSLVSWGDEHERQIGARPDPRFAERWFARPELHEAIDQLQPVARQVVLLRHFVGLEYAEIAAITQRSPEAVRQVNSRALRELGRRMRIPQDLPTSTKHERRWMRVRLRRQAVLSERRWCLCGVAGIPAWLR
jgi:RNA polymerase sigma-70 factor (ECF subfamily)